MRGLKRPENREWDEYCIIQEGTSYAFFFYHSRDEVLKGSSATAASLASERI